MLLFMSKMFGLSVSSDFLICFRQFGVMNSMFSGAQVADLSNIVTFTKDFVTGKVGWSVRGIVIPIVLTTYSSLYSVGFPWLHAMYILEV